MAPARIMFIRHAEKPKNGLPRGVTLDGTEDPESLTPRGWQRAGALVRHFCPRPDLFQGSEEQTAMTPTVVFAAGTGPDSPSQRPIETATPLVDLLNTLRPTPFITHHLKADHKAVMDDVLAQTGTVLLVWEHKEIAPLAALIPDAPKIPKRWPDDRFDIVWIFDRTATGWTFSQQPQLLLSGDSSEPIE
jgi:hypothetical protein